MNEPSLDRDPFEQVAEEFLARYRAGERPSINDLATLHPELAEQIRELLPALVMIEQDLSLERDPSAASPTIPTGSTQLRDYRLIREIGRGGMGVVYEAEQISLGRRVALKVLPSHITQDRKAVERFRREAKAAARLHHANIVPIFEVGHSGDVAYFAMQLIQGQGLDQVIDELRRLKGKDGRPSQTVVPTGDGVTVPLGVTRTANAPPNSPVGIRVEQLARSVRTGQFHIGQLGAVADDHSSHHARTVTEQFGVNSVAKTVVDAHLPLSGLEYSLQTATTSTSALINGSTGNSVIGSSGRRRPFYSSVAQIGRQIAQGLAHAHVRGILHRDIKPSNLLLDTTGVIWIADFGLAKSTDEGLTATGDVVGTLRYMAPERFRGEGDASADIYALGLTLYELLTLQPAFDSSDRLGLIERIKGEEPPRPRALDERIPRDLETIILKAIDKEPGRRYQTADAMAEDLRRFLNDETILARRPSPAERYARWARHHPTVAVLASVLAAMLVVSTIVSLVVAGRMSELATNERSAASAERAARTSAVGEAYRAMLSEAKALRIGHEPGWRDEALAILSRLAKLASPRRDLRELRTEAAAALGTPDVHLDSRVDLMANELGSFAFNPDGKALVTASRGNGLDFWDTASKSHVSAWKQWKVSGPGAQKFCFLPNNKGLVIATAEAGVVFTDMQGNRDGTAAITEGKYHPTKLMMSADGRRIAVGWSDAGGVVVYDVPSRKVLQRFPQSIFALSPDGNWLARGQNAQIVLTPIAADQKNVVLGRHERPLSLAFSPDGSILAVAFADHTTILWDVIKREQYGTLRGHREKVYDVAFSPDGGWIATASLDYTAKIWDTRTGQNLATLPCINAVRRVVWSPTGEYLATSTDEERTVYIYEITGRNKVQRWLAGHRVELREVAAHPSLDRFMTSGYTEVSRWDLGPSSISNVPLEPNSGAVMAMEFSSDGALLATSSWKVPSDREVVIRDGFTGQTLKRFLPPEILESVAFDPTNKRIACGGSGGVVAVYNLETCEQIFEFRTGSRVFSMFFLEAPARLLTHGGDAVLAYHIDSGRIERVAEFKNRTVRKLEIDRKRSRLIVGFNDGSIQGLSLANFKSVQRLNDAHDGSVERLTFTPDGSLLVSAGADRHVVFHDADTFEPIFQLPAWTGSIRDLSLDHRGQRLMIVGTNCDVDLWDIAELRKGLQDVGLAWDELSIVPVATVEQTVDERRRTPSVVVMNRSGASDIESVRRAHVLIWDGLKSLAVDHVADSLRDFQQAHELLNPAGRRNGQSAELGKPAVNDATAYDATSSAVHERHRALELSQVLCDQLEAISIPSHIETYNLACAYAKFNSQDDVPHTPDGDILRELMAKRAVDALRSSIERGMHDRAHMDHDRDLDSLRSRADFRLLMLDLDFPQDPFAPMAAGEAVATDAELIGLTAAIESRATDHVGYINRARYFARHQQWKLAHADSHRALELHPSYRWNDEDVDSWFAFQIGLVCLQANHRDGHQLIVRSMLETYSKSPCFPCRERTAKLAVMTDSSAFELKRIHQLADENLKIIGTGHQLPWLQLTRGMAAYRAGEHADALQWLRQAEESKPDDLSIALDKYYCAMTECKRGNQDAAKAFLNSANAILSTQVQKADWGNVWPSIAETQFAKREAEAMLLSRPSSKYETVTK